MEGGADQQELEQDNANGFGDETEEEEEDGSYITAESEHDGNMDSASSSVQEDASQAVLNKGIGQFGCDHYRRRCILIAPCCNEPFWCRHCHNAVKCDNEQDPQKRHVLDRKAVQEIVCAQCDTRQPASHSCIKCGSGFGLYTCLKSSQVHGRSSQVRGRSVQVHGRSSQVHGRSVQVHGRCNFFDDDLSKQQYHCDDCGICRVGGREHYFHCRTCNCCYATSLRDSHVCIENSMHHNCPVCFEYLFESIKPINVMPCGHTIHQACLRQLADHHTYVCPVCSKTYMNGGSMSQLWNHLDTVVAQTPMPQEYNNMRINVLCNDCNMRFETAFHVVGHKCNSCGGYNTRRV